MVYYNLTQKLERTLPAKLDQVPTKIIFGKGAQNKVGALVSQYGKKSYFIMAGAASRNPDFMSRLYHPWKRLKSSVSNFRVLNLIQG